MGKGTGNARLAAVLVMCCAATARAEDLEPGDLLEDLPFWQQFYTLRAGLGYSDNILYSELNRKSTAMLVSGFDATVVRLPLDGTEVDLFASIDDHRYFEGGTTTNFVAGPVATNRLDDVRGERTIVALARVKRELAGNWQVALGERYFYEDEVVDLSVTEADLTTLPVQAQQFQTSASVLNRFRDNKRATLELNWQRQKFEQPEVDDYSEYGPKVAFGIDLPRASAIELSYQINRRDYDSRLEYGADGTPRPDTRLHYLAHTAEIEWRQHLDQAKQWWWQTRLGFARNDDGGAGFFNYDRYLGLVQLRFRNKAWQAQIRGQLSWYQYDRQLSDENPGERRERFLAEAGLRASRRLGKSWRVFADYSFEQAQSNLSYDNYTVNVVSSGIEWEF